MIPVALQKAESLTRFAAACGVNASQDFQVALTLGEAYELLDYLAAGGMGQFTNHELLKHDIADAKALGDPWLILTSWHLMGLEIVRMESLN